MMPMFSAHSNGLQFIFGLMCLIEASQICLSWVSASSSDMLIIRHGRSRVRHSSEKNHIRWGLQAFDNLTLYDYDYESANGTSNETLFDFGLSGANQTFLGAESFGYFSSDTLFNNGTYTSSSTNSNSESKLLSTLAPSLSASSRWSSSSSTSTSSTPPKNQKLAKKQIMENIRKNVEEGIEYLRTHAHLTQPTAIMPSEKALLQLQKQAEQLTHNTDKSRPPPNIERDEMRAAQEEIRASYSAADPFPIPNHFKSSSSSSLEPFNHPRTEHNQSHQKKHKIDKQLHWKTHQMNSNDDDADDDDTMGNNLVDGGEHGKANHFDYEMQNDEAPYNENVNHPNKNHPYKSNKSNARTAHEPSSASSSSTATGVSRSNSIATMKTIDSIVTSINAAVSKKFLDQAINNNSGAKTNLNGNSNATKANLRSQSNIKSTLSRSQSPSNEKRKNSTKSTQTKIGTEMPISSVASLVSSHPFDPDSSSSGVKQNDSTSPLNVKSNVGENLNNQFESNGYDELNDEQQANDDFGDGPNFYDNDGQTISIDGKTINSNDADDVPIFRMEDIDLDDLDEISRNNRLALQKGRDVVTKFLQIVESQHGLGANCTAGTALNLGEGVVDRYAQDRFRVEAEVAVNRANMLTR